MITPRMAEAGEAASVASVDLCTLPSAELLHLRRQLELKAWAEGEAAEYHQAELDRAQGRQFACWHQIDAINEALERK